MAQELTFDTKKPENAFREQRIDPLRRGERGNRELTVSIVSKGVPYDLTGCTVRFVGTTGGGQLVGPSEIKVTNATAGMVRHLLPAEMSTDAGLAHWYYEIYKGEDYLDTTDVLGQGPAKCRYWRSAGDGLHFDFGAGENR